MVVPIQISYSSKLAWNTKPTDNLSSVGFIFALYVKLPCPYFGINSLQDTLCGSVLVLN
jgi:hypothetical protein